MLSPVRLDKNFGNLISVSNFLFGEASPLIDPRTSTQAGRSFFCGVKGGKKSLLVPIEKWVSHEYLCILGNFLEQLTYLHFTFLKNIPAEMLVVHELHYNTPCAHLGSLLTMVIRWPDGCFGRFGSECTRNLRGILFSVADIKMLHLARPFELRKRFELVKRFYVKEFFNPWHSITLTVFLN